MTIATKTTIKTYFETGDFPTQQNFTDLIDSFLGLGETASQTINSPIVVSGAATFRLGATVSGATGLYGDITFGTSAASTARTSLGLGTAAVLNTGVSANNIPKLDSSNRLPAVNGSLLTGVIGKLTPQQFTDATDITLSEAPTQTNVGTAASFTIPTKGLLLWVVSGEMITATAANEVIFGLRIGATNYWPTTSLEGSTRYFPSWGDQDSAPGTSIFNAFGVNQGNPGGTFSAGNFSAIVGIAIEQSGIPTGVQTVQPIASKGDSSGVNACTLKGTAVTTRFNLIAVDCS